MNSGTFSPARLARLHDSMAGHVERGALPGLVTVVSRRGETHIEAIGNHAFTNTDSTAANRPMQRDTIFRIASMTKPIVAVAALILIEEGRLRLDDAIERWLPELANRRVLRAIDSPLDDTVPAKRPISVRDLLTFRLGFGAVMALRDSYPIQRAINESGLAPGPDPLLCTPDEWLQKLGALPLLYQPGETWLYHTGADVLGVLIARVTGGSLAAFLQERIFAPLDMRDTGFYVPPAQLQRLPPSYKRVAGQETFKFHDDPRHSRWAAPPAFESGGGGLVSTADDYLAFCTMLLNKGCLPGATRERILSRPSVELMTSDQLTPAQKSAAAIFFGTSKGWGFGVGINIQRDDLFATPGRFGWDGGIGTSAYTDPAEQMIGILLTQRLMESPAPPDVFTDFWNSAYQAFDD